MNLWPVYVVSFPANWRRRATPMLQIHTTVTEFNIRTVTLKEDDFYNQSVWCRVGT
ncbi:hypothetical protein OAU99_02560 [Candidatus Poseidoniaceae archaeon]|jgi:hypothetical protein|nr:hypothetical protein [Candidatus Poseidoniaceae archaeon]